MKEHCKFIILGAGPTGLGAAHRWVEAVSDECLILEATNAPGGLASSFVDEKGFTWDLGSHLQFSHYAYYDQVLDAALPPEEWNLHERSTWVWINDNFIPYPFQLNLHHLTPQQTWACVNGLLTRPCSADSSKHFAAWCNSVFGPAITELFMRPYNEKIWQCRLEEMGVSWVSERVATPRLEEILQSICLKSNPAAWGPNASFRYPKNGGSGRVWTAIAARLPRTCQRYNSAVVRIDSDHKTVFTSTGDEIEYDCLLSTMPLPVLFRLLGYPAAMNEVLQLRSTCTHVIGIGLSGKAPEALEPQCWSYFPQADIPFYRLTVLSNLSKGCVPDAEANWSLMAEVAEPCESVLGTEFLIQSIVSKLDSLGLIDQQNVISRWHRKLPFGYPVPTITRDSILRRVLRALETQQIYSRGRFGAWLYEISNQDHSFMQGVELVNRLRGVGDETTLQSALRERDLQLNS